MARDRNGPAVLAQLLLTPMVDDRNDSPSAQQMRRVGIWDSSSNKTGWNALLEYVTPALEILNSHIELEGRTIVDTIADNAAYGGMILGGNPTRPARVDLRRVSALLYRNETIEETGVAAGVLNHPANGVAWLANKLHQHGARLEAGEIILSGSFTRPMWVTPGGSVLCDYGQMGTLTCHFV
ncbi:Fumarylacetoacetate (FAA) hydrolase family [Promicromonospora umidemergens]|uniref:2-oxo-hepta-3-ene-1,7-dioic acid hydratase n=1 Tax=Promicromonospora umidemergens TaxID=629679 RepID=A0ABP8XXZ5_9MICO|nr:Fumarylacetoacetate (FAA) hydrolase family [Promicromonospora umidemergens]